jgi:hypothetical protein
MCTPAPTPLAASSPRSASRGAGNGLQGLLRLAIGVAGRVVKRVQTLAGARFVGATIRVLSWASLHLQFANRLPPAGQLFSLFVVLFNFSIRSVLAIVNFRVANHQRLRARFHNMIGKTCF